MSKNIVFTFLASLFGAVVFGQQVTISGTVSGEAEAPLEMANIIVLEQADSSMSAFAFTDSKGFYKLKVAAGGAYILRISYLGYETADKLFKTEAEQKDITVDVSLIKKEQLLNEVNVVEEMPIMISGDTISYKADAFNKGTEKKLEDVLQNLPGVEIDEDGQIKVEGKVVEKVMVEGKDFFDGDTKIASKNIPANAIDKVQVLRNYNDVSPLGGVTNNEDRIAINIKLKEGKKNIFFGDVEVAAGLDERYLVHPNLFYYSPKASYNFIGDLNNVGQPAFTMRDYFRFAGGFRGLGGRSGSSLNVGQDIGIPMGNTDRNVEITSNFGALSVNFNPNKAWSISGFAIANQSDIISQSRSLNNYVGQDSLISREEVNTDGTDNTLALLGKFSAKYTPSTKLHIAYDVIGKYNETLGQQKTVSDFNLVVRDVVDQNSQQPFDINQNLEAIYDVNAKSIISFEAQYLYKRQDPLYDLITNVKPNFAFIPVVDSGYYQLQQNRLITTSKVDVMANYYYILNKTNHIEVSAGGSYSGQKLSSEMAQLIDESVVAFTDTGLQNDVNFSLSDVFSGVHYKSKMGKFTIRPGVNVHYYKMNDQQWEATNVRDWWFVLPDVFAKYDFKKSESLTLNYRMQASFTDVNNAALGAILKSYNSLFLGNNELNDAVYHSVNMNYFMYNMFNFTTIYGGVTYNKRIRDITNNVAYVGIDRANSPVNSPYANDVWSANANYQRRVGFYKITLGGTTSYSLTNNVVNDVANQNKSLNQNYNVAFATNFKAAPNVTVGYRLSLSNYTGLNVNNKFSNQAPYISFEWQFFKRFYFEADYRYNYYSSPNTGPTSIYDFLDASLTYTTKKEKWEFKLGATNLLNTAYIRQDSFSNSVTSTQEIYVLPRYILLGVKFKI